MAQEGEVRAVPVRFQGQVVPGVTGEVDFHNGRWLITADHVRHFDPGIQDAIRALPGVVVPPGHELHLRVGQNYGQGFIEYGIYQLPRFNPHIQELPQGPWGGPPPQQAPPVLFNDNARPSVRNGKGDECAICMEPLAENVFVIDDGTVADGPVKCGHKFHRACIQNWVNGKANPRCPICRGNISRIHPASVIGGGRRRRNLRKTRKSRKGRKSRKAHARKGKHT